MIKCSRSTTVAHCKLTHTHTPLHTHLHTPRRWACLQLTVTNDEGINELASVVTNQCPLYAVHTQPYPLTHSRTHTVSLIVFPAQRGVCAIFVCFVCFSSVYSSISACTTHCFRFGSFLMFF